MKNVFRYLVMSMVAFAGIAVSQDGVHPGHVLTSSADIQWGDPPPVFEQGAQFAVMSGDPGKEGLYTVRLKMPAGYKIAPHWHPTDEHVTVLSGTMAIGMGETFKESEMTDLPAGGYTVLPAEMRHYAMAKSAAEIEVFGMGPFALTYVNPADDPSTRQP